MFGFQGEGEQSRQAGLSVDGLLPVSPSVRSVARDWHKRRGMLLVETLLPPWVAFLEFFGSSMHLVIWCY